MNNISVERDLFVKTYGYHIGSTGSRLVTGNNDYYENLENYLANFYNGEEALLFNSGYDLNLRLLACLPQKDDLIFYDELIHNSMHIGLKLSRASTKLIRSFKHNSIDDLTRILDIYKDNKGNKLIAIESLG